MVVTRRSNRLEKQRERPITLGQARQSYVYDDESSMDERPLRAGPCRSRSNRVDDRRQRPKTKSLNIPASPCAKKRRRNISTNSEEIKNNISHDDDGSKVSPSEQFDVSEQEEEEYSSSLRRSGRTRRRRFHSNPDNSPPHLEEDLSHSSAHEYTDSPNNKSRESVRKSSRHDREIYPDQDESNGSFVGKHSLSTNDDSSQYKNIFQVPEDDGMDLYERVKRDRSLRHGDQPSHTSGKPDDKTVSDDNSSNSDDASEGEESTESDEEEEPRRSYSLRQRKPKTQMFQAPPIGPLRPKQNKPVNYFEPTTSRSPLRQSVSFNRRKKHALNSSTTSSSGDEMRFDKRKAKSMMKARTRCLPMNYLPDEVNKGVLKDRNKTGSSLADIDPMTIDTEINFDSVGGLSKHIQSLKEMVVFPLVYPEVFQRFSITPPRGCLFHGPPGTGKTLVARALANECSHGDRKVAFFMRKGGDCLSKWVGESERQLRLLFDQAYMMRPSIIFFDEIDGLAPVRSSRQDQIHSSIVSTLLALMDGIDIRSEVIIIGATNRIDSIDPALRRPGRFDREFLFSLPDKTARRSILKIHTTHWTPKLPDTFINEVADKCVGYCGADMKALCTEAALFSLRRSYPQIYTTRDKLQLDVTTININARDFYNATHKIVPTAQRCLVSPARPLDDTIKPLLQAILNECIRLLCKTYPIALSDCHRVSDTQSIVEQIINDDTYTVDEYEPVSNTTNTHTDHRDVTYISTENNQQYHSFLHFTRSPYLNASTHRPRLLLTGDPGQGQSSHIGPALLNYMEHVPVHCLDITTLYTSVTKSPEEACTQLFHEARRSCPSVIYIPHIDDWWNAVAHSIRYTTLFLINEIPTSMPVLILATAECNYIDLSENLQSLFCELNEVIRLRWPMEHEVRSYFEKLLRDDVARIPPSRKKALLNALEDLPVVDTSTTQRQLSESETKSLLQREENVLRELRLFLRDVLIKLASNKKFKIFTRPVDLEEVPDYADVVETPMDLSTMMTKIDRHCFTTPDQFLTDINLICANALKYNPDTDRHDKMIRHRACSFQDTAYAIIKAELDPEFERECEEIFISREKRGFDPKLTAPNFAYITPANATYPPPHQSRRRYVGQEVTTPSSGVDRNPIPRSVTKKRRTKSSWSMGKIRSKPRPKLKISETNKETIGVDTEQSINNEDMKEELNAEDLLEDDTEPDVSVSIGDGEDVTNDVIGIVSDIITHQPIETALNIDSSLSEAGLTENASDVVMATTLPTHNDTPSTASRLPRSRSLSKISKRILELLEEKNTPLIVDHTKLRNLLDLTVRKTGRFTISNLEKLHTAYRQCIYRHRTDHNKTSLTKELELTLEQNIEMFDTRPQQPAVHTVNNHHDNSSADDEPLHTNYHTPRV